MPEIRTVTTLRRKAEEIRKTIIGYEQRLTQPRVDLSHVTAAIAILEASDDPEGMAAYVDLHRTWPRGELLRLCRGFLEIEGPLATRELAERAMKPFGLDAGDKVLAKAVSLRVVHAMRGQHKPGESAGCQAGQRE